MRGSADWVRREFQRRGGVIRVVLRGIGGDRDYSCPSMAANDPRGSQLEWRTSFPSR